MHRTRKALLAALLVAVAVSLGLALSAVPNVELVSFTVFLSGFLLGSRSGAVVGAVSAAVFSTANPLGAGLPPLVIGQAMGQAVVGAMGGAVGPVLVRVRSRVVVCLFAGAVGSALTLFYDLVTTAGAYVTVAGEKSVGSFARFMIAGILFVGLHIVWNTVLFTVALAPSLSVLKKFREELTHG